MQLKDIFSASSDGVSQPSNSTLRFKQKALAATILATLAIIAFIAVEASDTKPARKAPTEAAMITLRPDGTDKDVLIARYDANVLFHLLCHDKSDYVPNSRQRHARMIVPI